jgi:hypothetical protein
VLRTRNRSRNTLATPGTTRKAWVEQWIERPIEQWDEREKPKILADWIARWTEEQRKRERIVRPGTDPGCRQLVPEDTPPDKRVLKLHSTLQKAESSVLVQVRTGRIGLAKYLYSRHVPGVLSAQCRCRGGEETPRHMAVFCREESDRRHALQMGTSRQVNYRNLTGTASGAKLLSGWIIRSGRLGQFALARSLLYN